MPSKVFFGSARQTRLEAKETLPAKLDMILERLGIKDRVKDETVAIKMHIGNNIGYSTIHPVFVRKLVHAVKQAGGKPFITDVDRDITTSESRGYTQETIGCPIIPSAGIEEKYFYEYERPFKNISKWKVGGMIHDASFLINFSHIKGHPTCGFGGAIKNLALGCMAGDTRRNMHKSMHFDQYFFPELCPDPVVMQVIEKSCPFEAIVVDKKHPEKMHLHIEQCNQCGRCLKVAPPGSLKIDAVNFNAFQEACAIATSTVLSTFDTKKVVHVSLATQMTPVCDCFGFTTMPILQDVGIFGSEDIVAIERSVLDATANQNLIEENLPTVMEVHTRKGHPFRQLHGPLKDPYIVLDYAEKLGIGSQEYELVDVMPLEKPERSSLPYIPSH
jgi:uncharacterized protein